MKFKSKILNEIYNRVHYKNKNALLCFIGDTGSGKSYSALRFGEMLNPDFSIRKVVFTPLSFMDLLVNGNLEKGDVIIFDEAGVGIPNRDWAEIQNKLFSYIMQTFRYKNLIVIFTLPHISYMDYQVRKLLHYIFEMKYINYDKKKAYLLPKKVVNNIYSDYPLFVYPKFSGLKITRMSINLPNKTLIDEYEKKKQLYAKELEKDTLYTLSDLEKSREEQKNEKSIKQIYKEISNNPEKYIITNKRGKRVFDKGRILFDYQIGSKKIEAILSKLNFEFKDLID